MLRIIWSESSLADLRAIDDYLGAIDPVVAVRVLKSVRDRTALLARYPAAGPALTDGQRHLAVRGSPYVIIYVAHDGQVEILRVRHHAEDWRSRDLPDA